MSKAGAEPGVREKEAAPPPEVMSSATSDKATSDKTLLPFEERKKHLLWIWIPVVIGLGLLIAAGYVGGRIWTSKPQVSSEAPVAAQVAQTSGTTPTAPQSSMPQTSSQPNSTLPSASDISPVAPAVGPAAAAVSSAAPDDSHSIPVSSPAVIDPQDLDVITPQPGERYIQISALNTDAARKYVDELRHGPLSPHLAPGPRPNLLRVLIGPFKDTSSLLTTRSDLLAAGIDCFVREY